MCGTSQTNGMGVANSEMTLQDVIASVLVCGHALPLSGRATRLLILQLNNHLNLHRNIPRQ
jgi:hypothetical protein